MANLEHSKAKKKKKKSTYLKNNDLKQVWFDSKFRKIKNNTFQWAWC